MSRRPPRDERIAPDEAIAARTLAGGVSNRTVLVERPNGEAWVLKQALAKLRVAVDWFSSPERIHSEALGLRWLARLAPPGTTTMLVFEDDAHHLLAMQAVPQPHENWKAMLLAGRLHLGHVEQFGRLIGAIHRDSTAQRGEIEQVFADRSFFEAIPGLLEAMPAELAKAVEALRPAPWQTSIAGMRAAPNLGPDYGRDFEAIYSELAARNDLLLYPFFLDGVAGEAELNQRDGLHPTAAGVEAIVARILPKVEELVSRVRDKRVT